MHLIDPESRIKSVAVLYQMGSTVQRLLQQKADGTFDPLPGAERLDLRIDGQRATGLLKLALSSKDSRYLLFQCKYVNGAGRTVYTSVSSRPLEKTPVAGAPPAAGPSRESAGSEVPPGNAATIPLGKVPQSRVTHQQFIGKVREVADLTVTELTLPAKDLLPCLVTKAGHSAASLSAGSWRNGDSMSAASAVGWR